MEKKSTTPLSPFDELTIPSELQLLKLILPYTPVTNQKMLGILIKFLELEYTIDFFQHCNLKLHSQTTDAPVSFSNIISEIAPYLSKRDSQMLASVQNILNILEMMQTFQDTSSTSPADLFSGMLSPEQQEMFQMYQTMFQQEGDSQNERLDESSTSKEYKSDEIQPHSDGCDQNSRKKRKGIDADYDGSDHECK
ncbi:MAG: hypothetical protein ACLUP8_03465 [Ruminococcus sp.]|uniref:hypothetical protein n=1 Tax=Ruminococcus sp. TaxID=41978 RepID=UPI003991B4E7